MGTRSSKDINNVEIEITHGGKDVDEPRDDDDEIVLSKNPRVTIIPRRKDVDERRIPMVHAVVFRTEDHLTNPFTTEIPSVNEEATGTITTENSCKGGATNLSTDEMARVEDVVDIGGPPPSSFRIKTPWGTKIDLFPLSLTETQHDGTHLTPIPTPSEREWHRESEKEVPLVVELSKDMNDSKPSATALQAAKGIHTYISTLLSNGYSLRLDTYCATTAGKAGTDIELFDFMPHDHMFTFQLSKPGSRLREVRNDGYIDFVFKMHLSEGSASRIPGTNFAYDLGKGVRLDLTDKYFLIDSENCTTQRLMPEGFPKVVVDDHIQGEFLIKFRFHQFDSSVKLYYDPWFRFWDSRHGRFDVISDSHTDRIPVHFGKEWPVSINDPFVTAVDEARRRLYPTANVEDLIYQILYKQKKVQEVHPYMVQGRYPSVKDVLDKAGSWWGCEINFEVKIVKASEPVATVFDRWYSFLTNYTTTDLEARELVKIRAYDPHAKIRVYDPHTKSWSLRYIQHCYTGQLIKFEASKSCYIHYQWEFDDGSKTKDLVNYHKAAHKFEEAGEYVVALTVYNNCKSQARTVTTKITVKDTKLRTMKNNWKVISALATLATVISFWEDIASYVMVYRNESENHAGLQDSSP